MKKNFFGSEISLVRAADDISFELNKNEILVIAGESGSGKSTTAKLILHSIIPDEGSIEFNGKLITNKQSDIQNFRLQCQMIHQDPYDSINPRMTIGEIISEPLEIHKIGNPKKRRSIVIETLKEVKLEPADEIYSKFPHMLSGGQRQRVVVARALILKPKIIIADEPVSMLDVSIRAELLQLIKDLQMKNDISIIYITHDLSTAKFFGDRIAVMYQGKIVEIGPIEKVLDLPKHPYTQALLDAISFPDPDNIHKEKKVRIKQNFIDEEKGGCNFKSKCPYVIEKCDMQPPLVSKDDPSRKVACFIDLEN